MTRQPETRAARTALKLAFMVASPRLRLDTATGRVLNPAKVAGRCEMAQKQESPFLCGAPSPGKSRPPLCEAACI
jgi:hypothetical protein